MGIAIEQRSERAGWPMEGPVSMTSSHPVVLIRQSGVAHGAATRWATALAAALGSEVVVVRQIAPRPQRVGMLFPRLAVVDGLRRAEDAMRLMKARLRWTRQAHGAPVAPLISVEQTGLGDLAATVASLNPAVIVVPARAWPGERVSALAALTGVSVLAARPHRGSEVVAASSLTHEQLPVVRAGARFAHLLGRSLTVTHNLEPLPVAAAPAEVNPTMLAALEQDLALKLVRQLEAAAREFAANVTISRSGDTPSGIVDISRTSRADLVIVGCDEGPGLVSRRVTPRVVDEAASSSVLVVPIRGNPASSAEAPRTKEQHS